MHAHPVYSNVFSYVVMHHRLVVCSSNNFISFCMARVPCYRGVVYKFKYLKS